MLFLISLFFRNYTGDVLNFGLAKEQYAALHPAKAEKIKFLVVGDDVAVGKAQGNIVGRRHVRPVSDPRCLTPLTEASREPYSFTRLQGHWLDGVPHSIKCMTSLQLWQEILGPLESGWIIATFVQFRIVF